MTPRAVLHIPHSSEQIPYDLRSPWTVTDKVLSHELLVMTDRYTAEIFAVSSAHATPVQFPVSRLVLDPERYRDDALEQMAERGMGVTYTRTSDGKSLREPPSESEREHLLTRFYDPHHAALSATIKETLEQHGACLLVDCHSFPSKPLPCDLDQNADRPDICLGTVQSNTPDWLQHQAKELFQSYGLTVEINRPYAGVLVPETYTGAGSGVSAIMIEINRRLYMNEQTGDKLVAFTDIAEMTQDIILRLIKETAARCETGIPPA